MMPLTRTLLPSGRRCQLPHQQPSVPSQLWSQGGPPLSPSPSANRPAVVNITLSGADNTCEACCSCNKKAMSDNHLICTPAMCSCASRCKRPGRPGQRQRRGMLPLTRTLQPSGRQCQLPHQQPSVPSQLWSQGGPPLSPSPSASGPGIENITVSGADSTCKRAVVATGRHRVTVI